MRKILLCVILIFICLTIIELHHTWGLFETNNTIVVQNDIAKWQIKVNDSSINSPVNFVVDNYLVNTDANVKQGLLAPGTTAYFDIEIDPNDTSVSIRYDIYFDMAEVGNTSVQISNVEEINNNNITLTDELTYTGVIPISDSDTHTVRVYIEWVNDENNNEIDSSFGLDDESEINIPVNIRFSQYLNDIIVEYQS